jgi:hypothetical protein
MSQFQMSPIHDDLYEEEEMDGESAANHRASTQWDAQLASGTTTKWTEEAYNHQYWHLCQSCNTPRPTAHT